MEVYDLELEVAFVVRLVRDCLNGRLYFLWCLSRIALEGKALGGCLFGMVMREGFFIELFFFDGGCLWKVAGSIMGVVVVEMVVWVV